MPMDIRWCNDVPLGRCQGSNDRRKRIKKAITYLDFMQDLFLSDIEWVGFLTSNNNNNNNNFIFFTSTQVHLTIQTQ